MTKLSADSRSALSRARLFLEKAQACSVDDRVDFEAYIEAAIIFARSALHRFKTKHEKDSGFQGWWKSLRGNPAVEFFRAERDFVLKEAAPKIGQKVYVPSIGDSRTYVPTHAKELYYFESPDIPATDTIEGHLKDFEQTLRRADRWFSR
jgi:hypothetical protein